MSEYKKFDIVLEKLKNNIKDYEISIYKGNFDDISNFSYKKDYTISEILLKGE